MNTANFSEYLQNPSLLYQISYEELKTLIVQYPYSQNLRYLIAQKSNMENNPDYEHFLRSAAIISTDRVHLYHILKMQKTEAVMEDSFILEEETLELKDLNVLDLNQVPLEPIENTISDTNLDLNTTSSLQEQDSIFNTFPELSPDSSSDLEKSPIPEEEEIPLPTLNEEVAIANLLDGEVHTIEAVTEEEAIEQLIDDTAIEGASSAVVATSIADLLADEQKESVVLEEVNLTDLFETEIPQTATSAVEETSIEESESIKFTSNITSIQQLLGEEDLPRRRNTTKPLRPLDRRNFKGNKQTAYKKTENIEHVNGNSAVVEITTTTESMPNASKTVEELITFQPPSVSPPITPATSVVNETVLTHAMPVSPGYDEEQIEAYASKSIEETADIASETYANLLVRQNQHQKAIQVYERLKLIFPEKSTFFAEQIKSLKQKL